MKEEDKRINILVGNKLIAEFLGARYFGASKEYELYGIIECIEDGEDEQHFFTLEQMMFHERWDWIMPVLQKIQKMVLDDDSGNIINSLEYKRIMFIFRYVDIYSLFDAIFEFIIEYNRHK